MLFLFFLFMLFVISTNQKAPSPVDTVSSGSVVAEDDLDTDELDNLVDKALEDDQDTQTGSLSTGSGSTASGATLTEEEAKSWFSGLFGGSDDESSETESTQTGSVESGTGSVETPTENQETVKPDDTWKDGDKGDKNKGDKGNKESVVVSSNTAGLSKNTPYIKPVESQYKFKMVDSKPTKKHRNLPGINLETKVGKNYEVGVHSLKLNNRYFNQTLAYMMEGDVVQQISEAKNGIFKVQILKSSIARNVGKQGFVSKKYLRDTNYQGGQVEISTPSEDTAMTDTYTTQPSNTSNNSNTSTVNNNSNTTNNNTTTSSQEPVVTTTQNDTVEYFNPTSAMTLKDAAGNEVTLMGQSDVLRKTGPENANGCFQVRIVGSNYCDNHGKVGYVCRGQLNTYTVSE